MAEKLKELTLPEFKTYKAVASHGTGSVIIYSSDDREFGRACQALAMADFNISVIEVR